MKNKFISGPAFLQILLSITVLSFAVTGCALPRSGRSQESSVSISPAEGIALPAIRSMAWLEDAPDGNLFVSVTEDGLARLWDIFSGLLYSSVQDGELPGLPDYATAGSSIFPLLSSDGTKKLLPAENGGIILMDAALDKELARYYGFNSRNLPKDGAGAGSDEWVIIAPQGFYNSSLRGACFLDLKKGDQSYRLEQLSGALYRPDLFKAFLLSNGNLLSSGSSADKNSKTPPALPDLFSDGYAPPLVSVSLGKTCLSETELDIRISGQKGGVGFLALYRVLNGEEIPSGLLDVKTAYELTVKAGPGLIGISAFNKNNTIESERIWTEIPDTRDEAAVNPVAALHLLLAASDEPAAALSVFFSQQKEGELYSEVTVTNLSAGNLHAEDLHTGKNDVSLIYIEGRARSDLLGNLQIITGQAKEQLIDAEDMLLLMHGLSQDSVLILDLTADDISGEQLETALFRLRHRLGPKAMLSGSSLVPPLISVLSTGFDRRFVSADNLLTRSKEELKKQGISILAFHPARDFSLADPFINTGELKFQTMTSGMLKIDQIDSNPVSLAFGDTMIRSLPPGNYIIDMIYRNGYRETRLVDLRKKDSKWVVFTYTPALLTGSSLGSLSPNRINIAELNPVNYEKINKEAMEGMGMAPFYVAYLAGERFYKDGNYGDAITEYDRAISLNASFAEAYVSRGNARRRTGDYDRAFEDYNRAIALKVNYAEVYNYRGYLYAQRGELYRAIADYTQAIRFKADFADAYFNRAYALGKQRRWDEAIADYTQVIKLEPSNSVAYNERGNAWKNKGDEAKAASDYAAAERLGEHN